MVNKNENTVSKFLQRSVDQIEIFQRRFSHLGVDWKLSQL